MTDNDREAPDLFKAAASDDIAQMREAISAGQKLSAQREKDLMTPLHLAAYCGSVNFIEAAVRVEPEAAWLRDVNDHRPLEHAQLRKDRRSIVLLTNAMYPELPSQPVPAEQ